MRLFSRIVGMSLCAWALFAQGDRGAITGTISDPAGAVVAEAMIEARNTDTGGLYQALSTATGNYTLTQLPAGTYDVSVFVQGFKKFVRSGITVQVASTLRVDVALEVGATNESVTVQADATLLKTESGELSHNVTSNTMNSLPMLSIGAAAGSSGIRNPTVAALVLPGTLVQANSNIRINGAPGNTASYRVEGQDASNGQVPATQAQTQPSVDAIQEVTIQTSNFAAEYGQVGGGYFNYTMRSGTNQLHGTGYDYWVNESLNAAQPWVNALPRARRNDYGFTLGGPVYLPKIYNGKDRTFFFFNFEQFRETQIINTQAITVPVQAYRDGNFQPALTTRSSLGLDPLGRAIPENGIYDPLSSRPVSATDPRVIRNLFSNNTVPMDRMDPVALKIQSMIPAPTIPGLLVNNAIYPYNSGRVTDIPAVKADHSLSSRMKLSYYWHQTRTASQYSPTFGASDGLPVPITAAIGTFITAHTQRLNFDYTVTPTVLAHIGIGYQDNEFSDDAPVLDYNPAQQLGLKGATVNRLFPAFNGLCPAGAGAGSCTGQGGMKPMGPAGNRHPLKYEKPTANASVTYVRNNHTYKAGAEVRIDSNASSLYTNTNGVYSFSPNQTSLPYLQGATVGGGTVGFAYASFLLGLVNQVQIAPPNTIRLGKHMVGLFVQDTWKVTRKLTLDYGVRWDYSTYLKEQYGRLAQFQPNVPNPAAGNLPGAVGFEGYGPGRCNCNFANNYPYAIGPRLGMAYQITPKTVLRAGFGVVYSGTGDANGATQGGLTALQPVQAPPSGDAVMTLQGGIPFTPPPFPNFDVAQYPQPGYVGRQAPAVWLDQNAGRPPRQIQWSVQLQREITPNLSAEVGYVGNRGAWWYSPGLVDVNALTPQMLLARGIDITRTEDRALLTSTLSSSTAAARGFGPPYAGYPTSLTVAQSLRPFPQFSSITALWSPLGRTWYDSLQAKLNKRFSRGLQFTAVFTWSKQLNNGSPSNPVVPYTGGTPVNDVFNPSLNKYLSQYDQPFVFTFAPTYTVPAVRLGEGKAFKAASWLARDWTIGGLLSYASGLPIQAPYAQNNLNTLLLRNIGTTPGATATYANRVPGVPLFLKDLNCNCFDPNKEFVLNPNAWQDPAAGQFGTAAAYYSDYRYQRRPQENLAIGRTFRFTERVSLNIRGEWSNIFNRSVIPNPTSTNALAARTTSNGRPTAGFGFINTLTTPSIPTSRQGTVVARVTF